MTVEDEFNRFIKMKQLLKDYKPPFKLSPSGPVDFIWHQKIVDTYSYLKMCEKYGHFFHHTKKSKNQNKLERYLFTLDFYKQTFKEDPPKEFWPSPKEELRECLYCLKPSNPFELENQQCDHFFCKSCILNFVESNKNCPLCSCSLLKPFIVNCIFDSKVYGKDEFKLEFYKSPTYEDFSNELNEKYDLNRLIIIYNMHKLDPSNFILDNNATLRFFDNKS